MTERQIPRQAILWLLLAEFSAVAPHWVHMPLWLWAVAGGIFITRWAIHIGRFSYPSGYMKTLAVVVAVVLLYLQFGYDFALESASSFLISASLLKLLEMRYRRDAYIVVLLGFFVLAVSFLFEQGIVAGISGIFALWCLTSALTAIHFNPSVSSGAASHSLRAGRYAAGAILVCVPLMLVLYLLFPRMSPLWTFNLHSGESITGLSDEISPGDVSKLGQSDELAFRVSFDDGHLPDRSALYWRAVVMDEYDGRKWKQAKGFGGFLRYGDPELSRLRQGPVTRYEIIQEPTQRHWLYGLKNPVPALQGSGVTADGVLRYRKPVFTRMRYPVESYLRAQLPSWGNGAKERELNIQLPADGNPEARQFAQTLRQEHQQPQAFIDAVLSMFRDEEFFYTLRPPRLGDNDIDEFLFGTRKGFCEHYAGAFVFLARSAGIPSRLVAGYQGGEWNSENRFLTVRQYDAHAWAEVWLEGQGWVRVDPTSAVAPERIRSGLEAAVREEGSFLEESGFSAQKFKGVNWINSLRLQIDSMNYYWQRWVLSYDQETQSGVLDGLLGFNDYRSILQVLAGVVVTFFLVATVILWLKTRSPRRSPFMRQWLAFTAKAQSQGFSMTGDETPAMLLDKIAAGKPALKARLKWLANEMNLALYRDDQEPDKKVIRELAKVRRQL